MIKYGLLFYVYLLSRLGRKPKKKVKVSWI